MVTAAEAGALEPAEADGSAERDVRWLSSSEQASWLALGALVTRLPAALDADLHATAGLSLFDYMVLAHLSEAPGRTLRMSALGSRVNASPSRLSHCVARLERRGWVSRSPLPEDGRQIVAHLSATGHRKVVDSAAKHVDFVRRVVIDVLAADQLEQLHTVARSIVDSIDDQLAGCGNSVETLESPPTPCPPTSHPATSHPADPLQRGQRAQDVADSART